MYPKTHNPTSRQNKISVYVSVAAITLLLIYLVDVAVSKLSPSAGLLPMNENQRGITFGATSTTLFFAAFVLGFRERSPSALSSIILIAGGALTGTSILGSIILSGRFEQTQPTFYVAMVVGYAILGLGILMQMKRRYFISSW
jgi:hypothetical protein